MPIRENHKIDYISRNSQCRINILVSTHIFPGVRNPIKALFSVLDHYNMLQHAKYTLQMVRHMPGPENRQIDYISGTSQRRIHILVSTHIFSGVRTPTRGLSAWQLRCLIVYATPMMSNCLWYTAELIPNDLDLTFQCHPRSNVMGQTERPYIWFTICVSCTIW